MSAMGEDDRPAAGPRITVTAAIGMNFDLLQSSQWQRREGTEEEFESRVRLAGTENDRLVSVRNFVAEVQLPSFSSLDHAVYEYGTIRNRLLCFATRFCEPGEL